MADNTILNSMTGGDTIAADDIAGVKYQRVKLIHGADGVNTGDVSSTNALPVNLTTSATIIETTTTPLGIGGVFTSATSDHSTGGAFLAHYMYSDVGGTHYFESSHDGTTWTVSDTEVLTGGNSLSENHQSAARYSRTRFVNGGTAQTTFFHQVIQRHVGQDEYTKISSTNNAVVGTKTSDAQGSSTNNMGVLPAEAHGSAPTRTEAMQGALRTTLTGDLAVTLDGETVPVTGTFYQATQPVSIATAPVLVAGSAIIGKVGIDQTTPGTTNAVQDIAATSGGLSKFHLVSAASTNATNVKASAGQVYAITAFNLNANAMYLKFHNTAGTPTAGASVTDTYLIPGNTTGAGLVINIDKGIVFSTGIGITLVTGITDASAVAVAASEIVLNIYYK